MLPGWLESLHIFVSVLSALSASLLCQARLSQICASTPMHQEGLQHALLLVTPPSGIRMGVGCRSRAHQPEALTMPHGHMGAAPRVACPACRSASQARAPSSNAGPSAPLTSPPCTIPLPHPSSHPR